MSSHDPDLPALSRASAARRTLRCVAARDLAPRVDEWNALALGASEPNPFFESWHLLPALEHLDPTCTVKVLIYEEDERLAGLLPILTPWHYYTWPLPNLASWLHANCFCGTPLVRAGSEVAFWQALLDWADRHAGLALFLHLRALVPEGPVYRALRDLCAEHGREAVCVHHEQRALLASDLAPDAYLEASLSTKKRKELRRQARRLGEEGALSVDRLRGDADLADWTRRFLALEAAGWKGANGSALASSPATAALFRAVLEGAAQHDRLERLALNLDGSPIAMLASFRCPPGGFAYKTAFDERLARFSPGVLLQQENLAALADSELAWVDSCASADHPMIDHIWRERRCIERLSIAIGGSWRRALFHRIATLESGRSARRPAA